MARLTGIAAAGVVAAGTWICAATAAASPVRAAAPIESAQEISLSALGAPGLDASGGVVTLSVAFPAPAGPLAAAGTFVRIFFSHSSLADPSASTLTVSVNGETLNTIRLDGSTAGGSVFEDRVPTPILYQDRPNVLDTRFDLRAAGGGGILYARLNPQTVMHYQLFVPPGEEPPSRLGAFPFPLVRGGAPAPLGLVLPPAPTDSDMAAALRLAADLGRRAAGQGLLPQVVTAGAEPWLRSSGVPSLLVGPLGRLPQAEAVLRAAGFTGTAATWRGPAGEPVGRDDGLLVCAASPWDGSTPLLLVTGGSDRAVAQAADLLVRGGAALPAGPYVIVRRPQPVAAVPSALGLDPGDASEARAPGTRLVVVPVAAPPVDGAGLATLQMRLSHDALAPGSALDVRLNGSTVGTVPLQGAAREAPVRLTVPGASLRPGRNLLTLSFRLAGGTGWARVAEGANLVLPGPPANGVPLLAQLPGRLFDDPGGLLVVLGSRDPGLLSAAARALAELGARTTAAVPALSVAVGGEARPGTGSLVAVGAMHALASLASAVPPATVGDGELAVLPLTESSAHVALWIDGPSADLLVAAAGALGRQGLPGDAVAVSGTGGIERIGDAGSPPGPVPPPLATTWVLTGMALIAIVLFVGWQIVRAMTS